MIPSTETTRRLHRNLIYKSIQSVAFGGDIQKVDDDDDDNDVEQFIICSLFKSKE